MSAAHRSSSTARRSLLTATAAGALLGALWFVPSANATGDEPARTDPSVTRTTQVTQQARAASESTDDTAEDSTRLADTGSFDTTPYIVGGTVFLALGAGFVAYSVRRERLGF
ncbi:MULTISPECIES: LAETG motif-containing sortase-dependent surface protein [unclassified Streptomyces]|uniref:LAETG motif-containing sortase-dependent surface protein n=1 Tax=unclassified Streptomyces TaxID=2593676 RepID=UPI002366F2D6|nr:MULTISPECIES: LAETG motif-containing sortase-dependent surface protein [unclassified Streptomyces]MDF3141860.1 LAETG motif-containing sortase-dependent surface protein [Streptomyces sp. T21Q-yed]WDF40827.1 LAETG motif-containing sortase-dependent surface protein [Streptomyces sp. T12]